MMNVLQGTQVTRQLPDAGSGKRAGRPARREGLPVGPNGRRKTGRGGGVALLQGRTQGSETAVREAGDYGASLGVPNTHWARTATAAELLEPQWAGEGQPSRTRAELWVWTAPGSQCAHPQELPCPSEHGQEAAVTW